MHLALDGVGRGAVPGTSETELAPTDTGEPWSEAEECCHAASTHPPRHPPAWEMPALSLLKAYGVSQIKGLWTRRLVTNGNAHPGG